jgi:hypothetical protein
MNIGNLVAVAPRTSSNVYILNIDEGEKCFLSQVDESWIWHRILGHLIFDNLIKNNEKGAVRDLRKVINPSNSICKHCQIGKKTRVRLKKSAFHKKTIRTYSHRSMWTYQN